MRWRGRHQGGLGDARGRRRRRPAAGSGARCRWGRAWRLPAQQEGSTDQRRQHRGQHPFPAAGAARGGVQPDLAGAEVPQDADGPARAVSAIGGEVEGVRGGFGGSPSGPIGRVITIPGYT